MKLLITGGFGYLGGRVAQFLAAGSAHEIVLGTRRDIQSAHWLPSAAVVRTRWHSPESLDEICAGVDAVVHCAGMNARDCAADPAAALAVNGEHTAKLVGAARRQRVKRFIYISTVHVYGSPLTGTITEASCANSVHPYATSHRAGEDAVRGSPQDEIDGIVVRLSNAYGAPADKDVPCWTLLINDLCRQAASTGRAHLRTSGLQRRDFIPLHEVGRSIQHLLEMPQTHLTDNLFNVGGEWSPTAWEVGGVIGERCEKALGFLPEISRPSPQPGEASLDLEYRLDALRRTGFQPRAQREREIDDLLEFSAATFR